MVMSMTGFGRHEAAADGCKITAEIKAVNHRYLDLAIKMPKKFNCFEAEIRAILKEGIQRGKVDLYITYERETDGSGDLKYSGALAAEYMEYFQKMADQFGIANNVTVAALARCPEVLTMEQTEEDAKRLWEPLEQAVRGAVTNFVEARAREGENLKNDLLGKLSDMLGHVEEIEKRSPNVLTEYRQKLEDKVRELLATVSMDESRIMTEVALFADKICVDEETVRLRSHIETTKKDLLAGGSVGRKLDFIAQEMNREANTILSKANDLEVSNHAIALKTEIEKIREQIQNFE